MQAREVLHKSLIQTCGKMHAVRREALETIVWAGLTSQRMTVTGLGRAIGGIAREKHNIKRADRLLSNPHLQSEREAMYGGWRNGWWDSRNIPCCWSIGQIWTNGGAIK